MTRTSSPAAPPRTGRGIVLVIAAAIGALGLVGALAPIEHGLRALRDAVRDKPASGALHIVEIDARSLRLVDRWPWPRSEHARLVDALTQAGARTIAFDIDFSSRSTRAEDAAFAEALARAGGGIILPTLRQSGSARRNDVIESLPVAPLREHSFLGAVSILPDADGYVRSAPLGIVTAGTPRPSLSTMLANRAGTAFADFPIDFAIDPATIPRHSFIDVSRGGQASALAGKDVLIGATAVEMGDRYAVPRYGVIPGVVIQALATETLRNGIPRRIPAMLLLIVGLIGACWAIGAARPRQIALRAATLTFAGLAILTALEEFAALTGAITPAVLALWSAAMLRMMVVLLADRRAAARIDAESGLPNRVALRESELGEAIIAGVIDRYDEIAATLGSDRMGGFMARLSERLSPAVGATIHRIEERVFAWSSANVPGDEAMDRLRALLLRPIEIDGRRIDVRISLGISCNQAVGCTATIDHAAAAASQALERGVFWTFSTADSEGDGLDMLSLMGDLDAAIESGQIEVHYQPKLSLISGQIESAEALVRWNHPVRGYIPPDLFIPLAERHERIDRLTLAVTEATLVALGKLESISIAVNLSAKLVVDDRFNRSLDALLDRHASVVERLIFEVTESAAMRDMDVAVMTLKSYRRRGIAISLDDYGTGQSTLSYLRELPLSELKIDRLFVQNAHQNDSDGVLVRSTIELAHQLGLRVVAEGVEDLECLEFLKTLGCDFVQGWLVSKPLPFEALAHLFDAPRVAA